ncbi:MAG: M48 family metallopeptidase [Nocardioides sp.]|uniref:M48 family metallopeptidase n=1 Tax=Nocardioides sp. TaxID=35761 RepID=UPI003F08C1CA
MGKPSKTRTPLPGISTRAWEHPADRSALMALRKLKGFDQLLKTLNGLVSERAVRLQYLGSSIRVDERQFPAVHRALLEAGRVLDVAELPEVYVVASPLFQATTIGMDHPIITLTSGLVDLLDDDELLFVVAHELGHAESGHAVYTTMLNWILGLTRVFTWVPGGALAGRAIIAGLYEWRRKSELSADRAGLLASQDPAVATRCHMKLAGGGSLDNLDITSFMAQASEYDETEDVRDSLLKLMLMERNTHPFHVVRARELRAWVDSGAYTAMLAGEYPRREDDRDASVSESVKDAANSYADAFTRTQDVIGRAVHDLAGFAGSARNWIDDRFRRGDDPSAG